MRIQTRGLGMSIQRDSTSVECLFSITPREEEEEKVEEEEKEKEEEEEEEEEAEADIQRRLSGCSQ